MHRKLKWIAGVVAGGVLLMGVLYVWWQRNMVAMDDSVRREAKVASVKTPMGAIAYRWSGPDTGQMVVMVHGFSVPSPVFDKNVEALAAAGYRVLTFDHFGRGYSDRPETTYDLDFYQAELEALWKALQIPDQSYLVGYSMGGGIAVHFAAKHPERVKKLLLMAPVGAKAPRYALASLLRAPGLGEWVAIGPMRVNMIRRFRHQLKRGLVDRDLCRAFEQQFNYRGTSEALLSTLRHFPMGKLTLYYAELEQLGIPVHLVWGDRDKIVPYALHRKILRALPSATLHTIPNAGHGIAYAHASMVNEQLLQFFGS